jgi:nitrate reductase assembly molybdenum cofactor insertion protein NarJ
MLSITDAESMQLLEDREQALRIFGVAMLVLECPDYLPLTTQAASALCNAVRREIQVHQ